MGVRVLRLLTRVGHCCQVAACTLYNDAVAAY